MTNNPFLKNDYPKWSELKPDSIRQDITLALEESEKKPSENKGFESNRSNIL